MLSLAPISAARPTARASPQPRPFGASCRPLRVTRVGASNKDEGPEKTEAERRASETAAEAEARAGEENPRPRSERTGDRNNPGWDEVKGVGQEKYAQGERGNVRKKGVDAARERAAELDDWTNN